VFVVMCLFVCLCVCLFVWLFGWLVIHVLLFGQLYEL
jgi:hypothetical protein